MKTCNRCNNKRHLTDFHKNSHMKDGRLNTCKFCKKLVRKKHYSENKPEELKKNRKYYRDNKDSIYNKRKGKYSIWVDNNREKVNKNTRKWKGKNKGLVNSYTAKRRAAKLNATLEGYDTEIKEIYKNCPEGHHVDHIMPLNHPDMCGLHVPWNLQYLPAEENLRKSNKIEDKYVQKNT